MQLQNNNHVAYSLNRVIIFSYKYVHHYCIVKYRYNPRSDDGYVHTFPYHNPMAICMLYIALTYIAVT